MLAALILLGGCSSNADHSDAPSDSRSVVGDDHLQEFRNVSTDVAFVGDDACFNCHEDQYRGFKNHGMARSMYPLTKETLVEDIGGPAVRDSVSGLMYATFEKDGRYYMEEYLDSPSGEHLHSLIREMKMVVGSGTSARTYLTESNGWYYEMPVTWYTQKRTWDFSPGYQVANKRFERKAGDRCIACHNSYPASVPFTNGRYEKMPEGISCERCHGPGSLHVDERLASPEPADSIDNTIVNPTHLSLDRRLDVCQQCHLNTSVSILREGKSAHEYRPSEPLSDFVSLFSRERETESDQIGVISHADRMKQSVCFLATQSLERPLECTTCHDPHSGFRDKGDEYFNATCRSCHETDELATKLRTSEAKARHSSTANCIGCHMPKKDIIEAPHSAFTDHLIRVVGDDDSPIAPVVAHGRTVLDPYYERDSFQEGTIYEGMAYVVWGQQSGETTSIQKGIDLLSAVPSETLFGEASYLLGYARILLEQYKQAVPDLERAVLDDPGIPERLNTLAQALEHTGGSAARIESLYSQALSIEGSLADIRINFGRFLEAAGRIDEAIEQYRLATDGEPWNLLAHYNLATAFLRQQRLDDAAKEFGIALDLDPRYAPAWSNLGLVHMARGEYEMGREAFESGIRANPDHSESLSNLGTYYLNIDDLTNAIPILVRAVRAAPTNADYLAKLALASFRNNEMSLARQYVDRAIQLDPKNKLALQILAAL